MFSSCWRDSITGSEAGGLFTDGAWVREEGERGRGLGQSLEDPEGELWLAGWEAGAGESWEGVPGRQGDPTIFRGLHHMPRSAVHPSIPPMSGGLCAGHAFNCWAQMGFSLRHWPSLGSWPGHTPARGKGSEAEG